MAKLGYRNPKIAPTEKARPHDILWAAGVFEGDGSICGSNGHEYVQVAQKDGWLLGRLRALFGGTIYPNKGYSQWQIAGARARGFGMSIYAFLSPRRQVQVRTLWERS